MKKISLIIITMLILVTGCSKKEIKKTDAILFKEEYESLNGEQKSSWSGVYSSIQIPEDNAIRYSNVAEILSLLENGTGVIYFGYPECPWCRSAISPLLNTANMIGIETIYYFNAKEIRDTKHLDENGQIVTDKEGTKEYYDLLQALDSVLQSYDGLNDENIKRLYFPSVVFVKEGEIIGFHESTVPSQTDPNILLTAEEEKELARIYSSYMHDILGDVCDKNC